MMLLQTVFSRGRVRRLLLVVGTAVIPYPCCERAASLAYVVRITLTTVEAVNSGPLMQGDGIFAAESLSECNKWVKTHSEVHSIQFPLNFIGRFGSNVGARNYCLEGSEKGHYFQVTTEDDGFFSFRIM